MHRLIADDDDDDKEVCTRCVKKNNATVQHYLTTLATQPRVEFI